VVLVVGLLLQSDVLAQIGFLGGIRVLIPAGARLLPVDSAAALLLGLHRPGLLGHPLVQRVLSHKTTAGSTIAHKSQQR